MGKTLLAWLVIVALWAAILPVYFFVALWRLITGRPISEDAPKSLITTNPPRIAQH